MPAPGTHKNCTTTIQGKHLPLDKMRRQVQKILLKPFNKALQPISGTALFVRSLFDCASKRAAFDHEKLSWLQLRCIRVVLYNFSILPLKILPFLNHLFVIPFAIGAIEFSKYPTLYAGAKSLHR